MNKRNPDYMWLLFMEVVCGAAALSVAMALINPTSFWKGASMFMMLMFLGVILAWLRKR